MHMFKVDKDMRKGLKTEFKQVQTTISTQNKTRSTVNLFRLKWMTDNQFVNDL